MQNNNPPQVITNSSVVGLRDLLSLNDMFTVVDPDPNSTIERFQIRDNGGGGGNFLQGGSTTLEPFVWHDFSGNLFNSVQYLGDTVDSTETFSVRVFDGTFWSNLATGRVSSGNDVSELTLTDGRTPALQDILVEQFISVFDADGDAPVDYYIVDRENEVGGGQFYLDGQAFTQAQFFKIAATDLPRLIYRGADTGPRAEQIGVMVYDGFSWSDVSEFEMVTSVMPVINPTGLGVLPRERRHFMDFFNTFDGDGDAITHYFLNDYNYDSLDPAMDGSGYLELNGERLGAAQFHLLTAAEIANLYWVGSELGPRDENVGVQVFDGFEFSSITNLNITTGTIPVVVGTDFSVQSRHYLNLSTGGASPLQGTMPAGSGSILNYFDLDGDEIEVVGLVDRLANANGGRLYFNGTPLNSAEWFFFDVADFPLVEYRGGDFGPQSEELGAMVLSNGSWSEVGSFTLGTLANTSAPDLQALSATARLGTIMTLRSLFSWSDADGDILEEVMVYDTGVAAGSGFITRDGAPIPAGSWHTFNYDDVDRYRYHFADSASTELIRFQVTDGQNYSTVETAQLIANPTPTIEAVENDLSLDTLESRDATSLIVQTDGGLPLTRYQVFDEFIQPGMNDRSGRLFLRTPGGGNSGEELQGGVVHTLTAEEFSRLEFQGAEADFGRVMDPIIVRATNDVTGWTEWNRININTDPVGSKALNRGIRFTDVGDPKQVITFSFIDGGNQGGGTRDNPNYPPLPSYYPVGSDEALNTLALNQLQRESHREVLDEIEKYANIDFVEVPYTLDSLDTAITFGAWGAFDGAVAGASAYSITLIDGNGLGNPFGDIWYNVRDFNPETHSDVGLGSFWRQVVGHEVGHSLAFKHPFDGDPSLSIFNNFDYNTIMAYQHDSPHNPFNPYPEFPSTFMLYDIQEIQNIYGANMGHRTGNDHYGNGISGSYPHFVDNNESHQTTLWDAGGIDTLNYTNHTADETIDLREGTWSSVNGVQQSLRIAYDAVIENARGGSGNDNITGNEIPNLILGNAGNDTLTGKGGDDSLRGGVGDDTYVVGAGDGRDVVLEEGGIDTFLKFDPTGSTNAFSDDFTFRRFGDDFRIDFTTDQNEAQGTLFIQDFANNPVELMAIHNHLGEQIGEQLDLLSVFDTATDLPQRYEITGTMGQNGGFIGVPV